MVLIDVQPALYTYFLMINYGIIPNLLDTPPRDTVKVFKENPVLLLVYWNNFTVRADYGNELRPIQLGSQPFVTWLASPSSFYTLLMTDPDALVPNTEFKHWLVVNIPGNRLSSGTVKAAYIPPGPPPNTGLHRYTFIIYNQPGFINFDSHPNSPPLSCLNRRNFSSRAFARQYNLNQIAAANFFRAQNDDSVAILYSQLSNC